MFKAFQFRRMLVVAGILLLGFAGLEYRLVSLQLLRHEELLKKAEAATRSVRFFQPIRGEIRDRAGTALALPWEVVTVYADPAICTNRLDHLTTLLAPLLGESKKELTYRLKFKSSYVSEDGTPRLKQAVVLKQQVPLWDWDTITNTLAQDNFGFDPQSLAKTQKTLLAKLRTKSIFAKVEQVRVYPYDNTLAHVLGYVTIGTNTTRLQGVYGIEGSCDKYLAGARGKCVSRQDASGHELPLSRSVYQEPIQGNHIILTIDLRLQKGVEQVLEEAVHKHNPKSASAIIVCPRTGEILAWAVLPNFSPQRPAETEPVTWRNRALSDWVEPGSTFKVITLAAALNEGLVRLDEMIDCEHSYWHTPEFSVRDHASYGLMPVSRCLSKSSNIGFAKIALRVGPQRLYRYLLNFGFGERTGVPLPYEVPGSLGDPKTWNDQKMTRIGFGQGIAVSQLQMAMGFCAIANNGVLMRPLLVSRIESPEGKVLYEIKPQRVRAVVTPQTADLVKSAMQEVVSPGGTGFRAAMPDVPAAGKTGTAQKSDGKRYLEGIYYTSFIGFFPADNPELCISVALDEPQGEYYASAVAAPVFKSIATQAAALLQIPKPEPSSGASTVLANHSSMPQSGGVTVAPSRPITSARLAARGRTQPATNIVALNTYATSNARN